MNAPIDIAGKRYGKLVAIERIKAGGWWRWRCDCGRIVEKKSYNITIGLVNSCGCLFKAHTDKIADERRTDIKGQRFGRLVADRIATPIERKNVSGSGAVWVCICDCGTVDVFRGNLLRSGQTSSCGCLRTIKRKNPPPTIAGARFGKLVTVENIGTLLAGQGTSWVCRCDCGATSTHRQKDLRNGTTTSCGCAKLTHLRKFACALSAPGNKAAPGAT